MKQHINPKACVVSPKTPACPSGQSAWCCGRKKTSVARRQDTTCGVKSAAHKFEPRAARDVYTLHIIACTLPETNNQSPLKIDPLKEETRSLETTIFRGELLVSGRVYITYLDIKKSWRLLKAHLSPPRI